MKFRKLGKSGLIVSSVSYGSWVTFKNQFDLSTAKEHLALAYDHAINFYDNAEAYAKGGAEELMGRAIKDLGWGRDTYCVSSKVFWGGELPTQKGLSRKHIFDACHAALRRLQVDYLDMYFCHRPDPLTPIEETVFAMNDLVRQGKVMYWGTSEWTFQQLQEAFDIAEKYHLIAPTMEQPQYNMFHRQKVESDFVPLYKKGLGLTIWSPLASGLLSGKYNDGIPEGSRATLERFAHMKEMLESEEGRNKLAKVAKLARLAKELEMSTAQMAIAWCMWNKRVSTVILGARTKEQLTQNIEAVEQYEKIDQDIADKIAAILD